MKPDRVRNSLIVLLAVASICTTLLLLALITTANPPGLADQGQPVAVRSAGDPLPVLGSISRFQLTDSDAKPFDVQQLEGKTWVAGFVFTRCSGPCPAITSRMAKLQMDIEQQGIGDRARLVSISVDPVHDTPAVLHEYARIARANPDVWSFLTGDRQAVAEIVRDDFLLPLSSGDGPIVHSQRLVLIDGWGRVRGYYQALTPQSYRLLWEDLLRLVQAEPSHPDDQRAEPIRQARR